MGDKENVKILILGPSQSGKTVISNWVSGHMLTPPTDYKETVACRILTFDIHNLNFHRGLADKGAIGGQGSATVELWDISGNTRYRACWPAIQKDVDGLLFVLNPDIRTHDKEVEVWYKTFTDTCGLQDPACCLFSHNKDPANNPNPGKPRLTRALAKLMLVDTSISSDSTSENFRPGFQRFVENVVIQRREVDRQAVLDAADAEGRGTQARTTVAYNKRTEIR
eukprot:TRINITY_DN45872_c0_g1_i1.p2 TRINITY_DN45872_c0_g1~~TRINITY_DN45872_c0_g1_i1.p2  ORF type:complete len:224 (+),score=39.72 TRINITY_DN45872_c0_g1_i1:182-853(+)